MLSILDFGCSACNTMGHKRKNTHTNRGKQGMETRVGGVGVWWRRWPVSGVSAGSDELFVARPAL